MTLHLNLPPETESRLRERAAATGVDPETVIRNALEKELATTPSDTPRIVDDPYGVLSLTPEERIARLREFAGRIRVDRLADDSRESIYGNRG